MSQERLFVIAGFLLLCLLVIGRSVRGGRLRAIAWIAFAALGFVFGSLGLGFYRFHHEKTRNATPELHSTEALEPVVALQPARSVADAAKPAANLSYFAGVWKNTNPPTRGLTKLRVRTEGESVWVHAWERCHPTDCDWGEAAGSAVAPGTSSEQTNEVQKVTATFQTSFSETLMTLTPADDNSIEAGTQTRFTDNSGRSSYSATYTLRH